MLSLLGASCLLACGARTGPWIPPNRDHPRPPPCSQQQGQVTLSLDPAPTAVVPVGISRVHWRVIVSCLEHPEDRLGHNFSFEIDQDPGNFAVSPPFGRPNPGTILNHAETRDRSSFTYSGQIQANWCVQGSVSLADGTNVAIEPIYFPERLDPPVQTSNLGFLLAQTPTGRHADPAFRGSSGCVSSNEP